MRLLQVLGMVLLAGPAVAQDAGQVSARSAEQVSARGFAPSFVLPGQVRVWGDPAMRSVVLAWEERFRVYHPEVSFTNELLGTDTAMGALYEGIADLALLGREQNQTEADGFLHSLQYTPVRVKLMAGSLDASAKSPAPVVFVAKENPLVSLSVEALDRALGHGQPPARTWGDLGATGPWASHRLHVYTYDMETGTGLFLLSALQGPGKKMNWAVVQEFTDVRHDDGSVTEAAAQTMAALRKDADGLAVSTLRYADDRARALTLVPKVGGAAVAATRESVIDQSYPLARMTYAFVNRPPNQPMPQPVTEFLRFVLSDEGQAIVAAQPGFLPLRKPTAAEQTLILSTK